MCTNNCSELRYNDIQRVVNALHVPTIFDHLQKGYSTNKNTLMVSCNLDVQPERYVQNIKMVKNVRSIDI